MTVLVIRSESHFQSELMSNGSKLIVVDFTAAWCMPCQRIAPFFEEMAGKYAQAVFLKVDVNKCEETAALQGVSVMPTFIFYKNKIKIDKIQGSSPANLEEKIKQYYAAEEDGDDSGSLAQGHLDLIAFVVKGECKALNESDEHPFLNCLSSADGHLESDCDGQLILPMTFTQAVKIHSVRIKAPAVNGPKTLRLFINQPNTLDFDTAASNHPVQEIAMTEDNLRGNPVNLSYVKFQNVQNLYIFVKDNQTGQETTRIDYIQLIGSPIITTKMSEFRRVAGSKGEAH